MAVWHVSTIAPEAAEVAREYGLGLEIAHFCTPYNMDDDFGYWDGLVRKDIQGVSGVTLHAPFSELCGAAIDPLVREVTRHRFEQAYQLALGYGATRMVVHSGFLPVLYDVDWFAEQLAAFWRGFLQAHEGDCLIVLENVFETEPGMLARIASEVDDPRFWLCLDLGHANTSGAGAPLDEWVKTMGPHLAHVHVHNNHGDFDHHLLPSEGSIDMRAVLPVLHGLSEDVSFALECQKPRAAVEWLQQNALLWNRD